ncbi:cell division topological specificity factor MinE [Thalassolituus hydrocarboniclasticus]|uniref:Cell division topological specificity factor n=1 Tax=Thalassolituus hydrocarboniclasticus TaxID=2742796 RepID=A0ABY6A6G6_9GAMM|nr:cell division topological specificity factor MinE [Thalassolituus hydrocarboniclasticus]UXD86586.1 cell division topological specificity factor MinE [Thalassolituus hydrocarboniclasticus]
MSLIDYFRKEQKSSASVAKERLQILVAHDRLRNNGPEYLPQLQQEIMAVIRKYVAIGEDDVSVHLEQQGTTSVLELNVTLPDRK